MMVEVYIYYLTDESGSLLPGLLEYLFEGVLPFLQCFYSVYFNPGNVPTQQQRDIEYFVSARIAKNIIVSLYLLFLNYNFFQSLRKVVIVSPEQDLLLRDTMVSLCSHEEIRRLANIDSKLDTTSTDSIRRQVESHSKHSRKQASSVEQTVTHAYDGIEV